MDWDFLNSRSKATSGFDIEPESQIRAQRDFINAVEIIAADAANGGARDQCEDVTVRENDQAGTQRGQNAALELIEEIGGVHQRESHARDGVFGQQAVNIFADEERTAQTHRLHRKTFGFEPFGEQRNLRGAAGAVSPFNNDERAAEFFGFHARKRNAVKSRRNFGAGFRGLL